MHDSGTLTGKDKVRYGKGKKWSQQFVVENAVGPWLLVVRKA
jgi:hypothetical protein